ALLLAVFALPARATITVGTVGTAAGFEDNDANLAPDVSGINFDWNSFSPSWSTAPAAPYRVGTDTNSGWHFTGLEDPANAHKDSQYAGGSKEGADCNSINFGP